MRYGKAFRIMENNAKNELIFAAGEIVSELFAVAEKDKQRPRIGTLLITCKYEQESGCYVLDGRIETESIQPTREEMEQTEREINRLLWGV